MVAVAPIESPIATAYMVVRSDSVSPTVAIASAPSRDTKNTSHTANTLSMMVSSTIGTASTKIARREGKLEDARRGGTDRRCRPRRELLGR